MKKLSIFLLLLTALVARENPFEPTSAYLEEQARMMEMEADYPSVEFQVRSKEDMDLEDMTPRKMPVNKAHPDAVAKTEAQIKKDIQDKKLAIKKAKKETLMKAAMKKQMAEKKAREIKILAMKKVAQEAEAKKAEELAKKGPMIYVKLREDVVAPSKSLELLPFLSIEYTDTSIDINTKYKVFKKLYLPKDNKLIIDFYAEVKFLTKRTGLESDNFKKIVVGNHEKEKYFRVVLVTKNAPSKYELTYNQDLVTITFNEEMSN